MDKVPVWSEVLMLTHVPYLRSYSLSAIRSDEKFRASRRYMSNVRAERYT